MKEDSPKENMVWRPEDVLSALKGGTPPTLIRVDSIIYNTKAKMWSFKATFRDPSGGEVAVKELPAHYLQKLTFQPHIEKVVGPTFAANSNLYSVLDKKVRSGQTILIERIVIGRNPPWVGLGEGGCRRPPSPSGSRSDLLCCIVSDPSLGEGEVWLSISILTGEHFQYYQSLLTTFVQRYQNELGKDDMCLTALTSAIQRATLAAENKELENQQDDLKHHLMNDPNQLELDGNIGICPYKSTPKYFMLACCFYHPQSRTVVPLSLPLSAFENTPFKEEAISVIKDHVKKTAEAEVEKANASIEKARAEAQENRVRQKEFEADIQYRNAKKNRRKLPPCKYWNRCTMARRAVRRVLSLLMRAHYRRKMTW